MACWQQCSKHGWLGRLCKSLTVCVCAVKHEKSFLSKAHSLTNGPPNSDHSFELIVHVRARMRVCMHACTHLASATIQGVLFFRNRSPQPAISRRQRLAQRRTRSLPLWSPSLTPTQLRRAMKNVQRLQAMHALCTSACPFLSCFYVEDQAMPAI